MLFSSDHLPPSFVTFCILDSEGSSAHIRMDRAQNLEGQTHHSSATIQIPLVPCASSAHLSPMNEPTNLITMSYTRYGARFEMVMLWSTRSNALEESSKSTLEVWWLSAPLCQWWNTSTSAWQLSKGYFYPTILVRSNIGFEYIPQLFTNYRLTYCHQVLSVVLIGLI